jgi:hypothetical protein
MSGLLRLANDFVERMMNPAFGPLVNDDYSMRLGELLADERSSEMLLAEARRLNRVDELSAHTWLWLLTLPGPKAPLSDDILLRLCQELRAPAFRVTVLNCVFRDRPQLEPDEAPAFDEPPTIEDIENPWLAELIRSAVREPLPHDHDRSLEPEPSSEPTTVDDAQSLLVALLSVDWRECREAAAALLRHDWRGHDDLLAFFHSRTTAMDEESRALWLRLAPPTQ